MTPEAWQRISTTLDELLDLDPAGRAAALQRVRQEDPEFCRELESLMGQESSHVLFDAPPLELFDQLSPSQLALAGTLPFSDDPLRFGQQNESIDRAGDYELGEEIARGGMGAIYRARDPAFDRLLAVKVLLPSLRLSPDAERRFVQEARITGQLQHPGIPPAHAVGRLPNDLPYFAMKLIEGRTLSSLLMDVSPDQFDPSWIGIFEQICRTLAYAHGRGILHRDLKPSNIMVGAFGEVQVMDWGLARHIENVPPDVDAGRTSSGQATVHLRHSAVTVGGEITGTPEYMAPEQARGEAIDLRCDVFGLGGVLCALLARRPPFRGPTTQATIELAARGDITEACAAMERAGADAALLAIARKCLASEPVDRYRDAGELADAVTSYREELQRRLRHAELEREKAQVQAREERRRRRLVVMVASLLLVLVLGAASAGLWYQQYRATMQLRADQLNRQVSALVADGEKARTGLLEQITDPIKVQPLLSNLDDWGSALLGARERVSQAQQLAEGHEKLLRPAIRASLSRLQQQLDQASRQQQFAQQLDAIRLEFFNLKGKGQSLDEQDPEQLKSRAELLSQQYAAAFERMGWQVRPDQTSALADKIRSSPVRFAAAAGLDNWALMSMAGAAPRSAEIEQLLELARRVDPDPWRDEFRRFAVWSDPARLQENLSALKTAQQPPQIIAAAASLLRQYRLDSTELLRAALIAHPGDFWLNSDLAFSLVRIGATESITAYRAALLLRPRNAVALNNLGVAMVLTAQDHESAVQYFRKALDIDSKHLYALANLANTFYLAGDYREAIAHYERALLIAPDHAGIHNDIAVSLTLAGEIDRALEHLQAAVRQQGDYALGHQNLAVVLRDAGRYVEALAQMKKAQQIEPTPTREVFMREYAWIVAAEAFEQHVPVALETLRAGLEGELTADGLLDYFRVSDCYRTSHVVQLEAGKHYQVDLTGEFDPLIRIEDDRYKSLLFNDDLRSLPTRVLDSRLVFRPTRPGAYRIVVSTLTPKATGHYRLSLKEVAPAGFSYTGRGALTLSDLSSKGKYYRKHTIELEAELATTIILTSRDFDTFLALRDAEGQKYMAWNMTMTHDNARLSRLDVTPAESGTYQLYVSAAKPDQIGAYELSVQQYR